jgi:uncharacterized protein (TIRG00374 family)
VRGWGKNLLRCVGLALLGLLLYRANWGLIGRSIGAAELSTLFILPLLSALMIAVRAWRWNMLLQVHCAAFSPLRAWSAYATGVFLGAFTPGRLGDLAKAFYARQERGLQWDKALAGALLDRLFDVLFMACLALWALLHLGVEADWDRWLGVAVGLCVISGLVFAFLWSSRRRGISFYEKGSPLGLVIAFIATLRGELRHLTRAVSWGAWGLTFLAYSIYFTQTVYLARAMHLPLTEADVVAAIVLVGLASFLPLSVAGLGTREGILALVMARRAVPDSLEAALAFSALFFLFCFVVPGLMGFACFWARPFSLDALRAQTASSLFAKDS